MVAGASAAAGMYGKPSVATFSVAGTLVELAVTAVAGSGSALARGARATDGWGIATSFASRAERSSERCARAPERLKNHHPRARATPLNASQAMAKLGRRGFGVSAARELTAA